MVQQSSEEEMITNWFRHLSVIEAAPYKGLPEPLTHLQNTSIKWQQPELGLVNGFLKIDYLPAVSSGYINTASLFNFLMVFINSDQIGEISAHAVVKIIYDGLRQLLGVETPLSITLEYSDAYENTIILALSSGDLPVVTET